MIEKRDQKSCWNVTAWAVTAAAGVFFMVWISKGGQIVTIATGG